jgi:phage-related protein (TIGR01555 family)
MQQRTFDHWLNPSTGVGGAGDKNSGFIYVPGEAVRYQANTLTELYEEDDIAARIIDAVVDEAMRLGYSVEPAQEDTDLTERIQDWTDLLGVPEVLTMARKWSRLYGGAGILIGSDDKRVDKPLAPGGSIRFVEAYQREELSIHSLDREPGPNFGKPLHYRISPMTLGAGVGFPVPVHHSRLIVLNGAITTRTKLVQNEGFGSSELTRAIKAISQFHGSFASALAIMADANQNVYKIKNLAAMIEAGNEELIKRRLDVAEKFRGVVKAIALDAESEDFIRSTVNIGTGLSELIEKFALRIAAAARMPVTVLLGQSPAGMNATGESDRALWQAQADTERKTLTVALNRIYRAGFQAADGPTAGVEPAKWAVKWPALWTPTAKEEAEIFTTKATGYRAYFDMGVLDAEQIAVAEFGAAEPQRPRISEEDIAATRAVRDAEQQAAADAEAKAAADEAAALALEAQGTVKAPELDLNASDVARAVRVNEARVYKGLPPLPANDPRGSMFLSDLDAEAQAAVQLTQAKAHAETVKATVAARPEPVAPVAAPAAPVVQPGTQDELVPEAPPEDASPVLQDQLAAQMTEHGVARCLDHNKPNRCLLCGVERVRSVVIGPDGKPMSPITWRRIGAPMPVLEEPEPDEA